MASPMVRVPEAMKEVVQKLAEIHRQGDKRREVEAGLQKLLTELIEPEETVEEAVDRGSSPLSGIELAPESQGEGQTADSIADNTIDSTTDDTSDSKTDSTSVVISDIINVEEVVNRLAILEEKLAALEPQASTDSSTVGGSDDKVDNKADDRVDNSADATSG